MKKYRLAYDNLFILKEELNYKGEDIIDLCIYMIFKVIDKKTNQEVYFESKDFSDQTLEYFPGKFCYVNNFYKCVIDEKEIYRMIPNEELINESNYIVFYEIDKCYKSLTEYKMPVLIEYEEFLEILKNNFSAFNNGENRPTQSTSYYAIEVE
ncbi:hypothetical protein [Phascolarctobacterium sp.]